MPNHRVIARSMTMLLVGSLFLALEVSGGSWTSQKIEVPGAATIVSVQGIRYDRIPDEVGDVLFILAFLGLWRVSVGAARKWFVTLVALQVVALLGTALDHFIIGQHPLRSPSSDWKGAVNLIIYVAMGWVITFSCQGLGLNEGARRWRRFATWVTASTGVVLALVALVSVLQVSLTVDGWPIPVLGLLYACFLFYLWASACFGTRSEALLRDSEASGQNSSSSAFVDRGRSGAEAATEL